MSFSTDKKNVIVYAAGLFGMQIGSATLAGVNEQLERTSNSTSEYLEVVLNKYYAGSFGFKPSADVAATLVANVGVVEGQFGLTAANVADAITAVTAQLNAAAPTGTQGQAVLAILADWSINYPANNVYGAAATAWNAKVAQATAYASTNAADVAFGAVNTDFVLTAGNDNLTGSAGDDSFVANFSVDSNTLNSGDVIDGGAGTDTLIATMGATPFSITPTIKNVENIAITVQNETGLDSGANNVSGQDAVQVDFGRVSGVKQIWSLDSRGDLSVEDVRIQKSEVTKDITIVMRDTDPGTVDFAVYFDQNSLRNVSSSTSLINLRVLDTFAASKGEAPLKDSPYGSFTFTYTLDGGPATVAKLESPAIQAAQTYAELVVALQAAADGEFGAGAVTVATGSTYTVPDSVSNTLVQGTEVVLSAKGNITFDTTPAGSGWLATETVPAISGLYTSFNTNVASTTALVTSTIVLDNVGRGSNTGDLIVGGLSTGDTSASLGVQRFDITVEDNSKLSNIVSTNNTLREVYIVNGTTDETTDAYTTTVKDAGNLSVGISNATDSDINSGPQNLDGSRFGFDDVRVIDGSAMKGMLAFTAGISQASIAKYLNLNDTANDPAADNVQFVYTGGANADNMSVAIDSAVVSSRSTNMSGREDFNFRIDGGAGNDVIRLDVVDQLGGGAQAWYTNQKLNANISINGGDGNDTIRTPGAGDVKINAGAGDDVVYTDNTGALAASALATGSASAAATAYSNAAAAELAAALAARVASNNTGFLHTDGVAIGVSITPAAQVALLATLDQITPTNAPALPVITHATLAAGTAAAAAAGAITLAQKVALDAAYGSAAGGVVTPGALGAAATLVGHVVSAGNVTAPQLAAGDAALAAIVADAKAAAATAAVNDANVAVQNALLNGTQLAVVNANLAVNGVDDSVTGANEAGTATIVAGLTTLQGALTVGATAAAVNAALDAATLNGSITAVQAGAIQAALGGFPVAAPGLAAATAILSPLQNTAALNNAAAQATLTAAIAADVAAVNTAAAFAAGDPVLAGAEAIAADSVGTAETTAAATAAATASAAAAADLAASQAINTALNGLKTAVNVGSLDADVTNAIANANAAIVAAIASSAANGTTAVTVNPLTAGVQAALLALAGVPSAAVDAAEELAFDTGALGVFNANSVDSLIIANTAQTDQLALVAANAAATATATATANTIAIAAANSGANALTIASPTAVFVFNTADQSSAYNRLTADERNLADLKSDANNSNNFFKATVMVSFMGLEASVVLADVGYKSTDLQINQAIKAAINNDAVLNKLLVATDGPANTLVVTSRIDGVQTAADLSVSLTLPTAASLTTADVAGAAAAYGLPVTATAADVLTAMTAAKTAFDAKGDYTTQFAESGAAGGNVNLVGANSTSSSDNTVTGGAGNDVIVLGTTVGTDGLTSSNEKVVYAADFGKDTIVNFAASGLGIDTLDFTALKGSGAVAFGSLSLDKSIVVAAQTAANDTAAEIAALFTDSATAIDHVYVAYDANNVGKVYMVADAAGVAAGNVTAVLVGTIDLADTSWASLTAANFA